MEFTEKDAARSKHRLSKKNQRGRGRGRGAHGWRGSAATTRQTRDLGTNVDRYESDEELGQPSEGPIRQSQGADLAQWLDQHPAEDPLFHARQRVNLHEEVGLPPAELDTFQGLSFDLKGLAECLSKFPLHEVLNLPPPIDEDGNRVVYAMEESNILEEDSIEDALASRVPSSGRETAISSAVDPPEKKVSTKQQQQQLPPLPTATEQRIPQSQTQPEPAAIVTEKPHSMNINTAEEDIDDELDTLLGLGEKIGKYNTKGAVVPSLSEQGSEPGEKEESLEAWLDSL